MKLIPGQALLLQISFIDGGQSFYSRPFLIIETDTVNNKLLTLNVSSVEGKDHKLLYDSNKEIIDYNPPFCKPSFVKLDAIYQIEYYNDLTNYVLSNGARLKNEQLNDIIDCFKEFSSKNKVIKRFYRQSDVN